MEIQEFLDNSECQKYLQGIARNGSGMKINIELDRPQS